MSTHPAPGAMHDFALFKQTVKRWRYRPYLIVDKGYEGIHRLQFKALISFKKPKRWPLTSKQKAFNREVNRRRIVIEHVFAVLKAFKILGTRYRNRRRRLLLRFNLLASIYNHEMINK